MATATLNAITKQYPQIANRIRASIAYQSSPMALLLSIIDTTAGHPSRTFSFSGIPRAAYNFYLDEIDGAGVVVNNLASFEVVPSTLGDGSILSRNDEQIQAGITPGFDAGLSEYFFDGHEIGVGTGIYAPNYIGWEIVPSELTGRGILAKQLDYIWDSILGKFNLIQAGDVVPENMYYNIHFNPTNITAGQAPPSLVGFQVVLIVENTDMDITYLNKKVLCIPSTDNIIVKLPDISLVPDGIPIDIEIDGASQRSVKFIGFSSDVINFRNGVMYGQIKESFRIYKYDNKWRVCNLQGNFNTVGNLVGSDLRKTQVINCEILEGQTLDVDKYARLYNEVVLQLDASYAVPFADWELGDFGKNRYKYSLKDPNSNVFHIPDRRGIFERNSSEVVGAFAGDYQDDMVGPHNHKLPVDLIQGGTGIPANLRQDSNGSRYLRLGYTEINQGTETRPKNYLTNKYVLI